MLRFGETKIAKDKIYAAKKPIKIRSVNVGNIFSSKLIKKTNSKYFILDSNFKILYGMVVMICVLI